MAGLTLLDIRNRVIAYLDEDATTSHFGVEGGRLDKWINDGLMEMVAIVGDGVEDMWIIQTQVGQRGYPVPDGIVSMKMVLWNGFKIDPVPLSRMDFYSTGTSDVAFYSLWRDQILLGPLPPSAAYTLTIRAYREPLTLVNDTDEPIDLPNRFRHSLADYAAAMACLTDGDKDDAAAFMDKFKSSAKAYKDWILYGSRDEFNSVRNVYEAY